MKQKYTLTVANSQINIVTEMSKEEIDDIVGIVDRRIREIHLYSKTCSRTDAAMLLCLDYCAENLEHQKTLKSLNASGNKDIIK
jgi:cell division protein ZapA (FtsZ GTPase activity inhibitor)